MKDFFISYNGNDEEWAEWIAFQLEEEGHSTVIQAWDFRPGEDFVQEMQKAANGTRRTIAVLTDNSLNAEFTQLEWANALGRDPNGNDRTMLPIRVEECTPTGLLATRIFADLVGLSKDDARETLLAALKERDKPESVTFPGEGKTANDATKTNTPAITNIHRHMVANRLFVGRKSLLKKLHKALRTEKKAAVTQTQTIHGLGGVGKTQLALEYAQRHQAEYDIIWWVRAEDDNTLQTDLADLAVPLGLLEPGQTVDDQQAIVNAVLDELSRRPRRLLIYDNAETAESLKGRIPGGDGHVLITSRDPNWQQVAGAFPVDVLTRTEARQLIKNRAEQTDNAAADDIASRLGWLPLALEVAAAYCAATGLPLSQYVDLLDQVGLQLLDESQPIDYATIVSKAWQPSFEKACAECEQAKTLLGILSFVAPDNFPDHLLTDPLGGDKPLSDAAAALQRFSLVSRRSLQFSIHRLVQEVFRTSLDAAAFTQFAELALMLVNGAFPGDIQTNPDSWPICDALIPHGSVIIDFVDESRDRGENNPLTRLLNQMALYHQTRARYPSAEPLMRRALEIDEQSFGEQHPNVAIRLNNLAQLLQATNRLSEAEPLMRRALEIDEQSFGEQHPNVAIRLNNLAALLQATNRLSEAEPLMRRALEIDEQSFGEQHPNVAIDLNNLAQLLQATNRLSEAEPLMRRALEIDEQSFGEQHPNVARDLNNLAQLLQATNRLSEAEPLMRRALEIDEQSFGEQHPNVARDLNNLAQLLQATNRLSEAEPLMRRMVEVFRDFGLQTGHEHPHMQAAIGNYSLLLQEMDLPEDEIDRRLREATGRNV